VEELKVSIERERTRLNTMILEKKAKETYEQSLLVDKLVEEYLDLTAGK
jgi:hypothetical protein